MKAALATLAALVGCIALQAAEPVEDGEATRSQDAWRARLAEWREQILGDDRSDIASAVDAVRNIASPSAALPLAELYEDEDNANLRRLWIETLGGLDSPHAGQALVKAALRDDTKGVREAALDQIELRHNQPIVEKLTAALKSEDHTIVNRAAAALERVNDPSTVLPLIDALVTRHRFAVEHGGFGGIPRVKAVTHSIANHKVLSALRSISRSHYDINANFQYDKEAWRSWHETLGDDEDLNR